MAHLLGGERLRLEYPATVVLDQVTPGVDAGDRIGIVGRNGDGKSSLLALLSGRPAPDSGRVTVRGGVRIGVLDQDDTLGQVGTVGHAVVADTPGHVWASDPRIRDVVAGLAWDAPLSALSGGRRRRVALAALLVGGWDVLLDDPSARAGSSLDSHEPTRDIPRELAGPGGSDSRGSCVARGWIRIFVRVCLRRSGAMSRLGW